MSGHESYERDLDERPREWRSGSYGGPGSGDDGYGGDGFASDRRNEPTGMGYRGGSSSYEAEASSFDRSRGQHRYGSDRDTDDGAGSSMGMGFAREGYGRSSMGSQSMGGMGYGSGDGTSGYASGDRQMGGPGGGYAAGNGASTSREIGEQNMRDFSWQQEDRPWLRTGQQREGKGPKNYTRSDDRLREEVCEQLASSGHDWSDVEVRVSSGEVTLTGTVSERSQKLQAEHMVDRIRGVKDVTNSIKVKSAESSNTGTASSPNGGSPSDTSNNVEPSSRSARRTV